MHNLSILLISGNKPKLKDAFKTLLPLAAEWFNIGVLLDFEEGILQEIEQNERREHDRLRAMLSAWLKIEDPLPTWNDLANAVEPFDEEIAEKIRFSASGQDS